MTGAVTQSRGERRLPAAAEVWAVDVGRRCRPLHDPSSRPLRAARFGRVAARRL